VQWSDAAVAAPVCAAGVALLMWRAEWLEDAEGRWDANGFHAAFVVLAALAGGAASGLLGLPAGLAVVLAFVNIFVGMLLAWGLAGGDGEADSHIAGVLSIVVFLGALAAFGIAVRASSDPGPRDLALMLLPAAAAVVAAPFVRSGGLQVAAYGLALFAVPPGLLALA
jgi:hypothetical protein